MGGRFLILGSRYGVFRDYEIGEDGEDIVVPIGDEPHSPPLPTTSDADYATLYYNSRPPRHTPER